MARTPLPVIPGERFGYRVVLMQVAHVGGATAVLTRCDCGYEARFILSRLRANVAPRCTRCQRRDPSPPREPIYRPRVKSEPQPTGCDREGYTTYRIEDWREMMKAKKAAEQ